MNTRGQGLDDTTHQRAAGKNYLFAIAIDQYQHSPPLYNCVRDAEHIIALLHRDYQFDPAYTYTLFNQAATEKNIFDTFKKLVKTIKPEDNLLVLYSGHGEFEPDIEEGYWIPVDAQLGDFSDYVSNSRIVKYLKALDAHHVLLIVDSCFSGTLFAHRNMDTHRQSTRLDDIPSRWLITAGRNEVVSDGKPGDHSPFADNIIYFLENNKADSLSVGDLSDSVIDAVVYNSRQTPRGEPLQDVGHRGGQFFFHRKGFVRPPENPAPPKRQTPTTSGQTGAVVSQTPQASGGSGFWIFGAIAIAVIAIVFLAGTLFRTADDAPAELPYEAQVELPDYDTTRAPQNAQPEERIPETVPTQTTTDRTDRIDRIEQAWAAATDTNTEEAYRRFIERFPKSRWVNDAEKKIAEKYSYRLDFGPSLQGGKKLTIHFGMGQAPFQIQIIKPNEEKIVRNWDSKKAFSLELGEIEKVKSGLNVLKIIVTDHNFKKAGHVLPVY